MSCEHTKTTGMENQLGTCVECAKDFLAQREQLRVENAKLQAELKTCQEHRDEIRAVLAEVAEQKEAEKAGTIAHSKGASLDDNPYDPDSDKAASWSFGWLFTDVSFTVNKMRAVMLFAANMIAVVRDVAAGGASGDEVAAKLGTVIDKLVPFIVEDDSPATG